MAHPLTKLAAGLRHAFALPEDRPLTDEEKTLLDRIAAAVRTRKMETPATMAVEMSRPLTGVGSNLAHALQPFLTGLVSANDVDQVAALLNHPRAADELLARLQPTETRDQDTALKSDENGHDRPGGVPQ